MSVFTRPKNPKPGERKHWHYAFSIRGVRYRGAIPEARTQYEAEKAETRIKMEVYEGRYGRPTGEHDFVKFVEEVYTPWARENKRSWKTSICYTLPRLTAWFKGKTFAQISPILIEKFKRERRNLEVAFKVAPSRPRSAATINRELQLLSTIFSLAITHKLTATNPCREVELLKENNKRTRYLLDEEELELFKVLTGQREHLRYLITVAIGTGMRKGDELNLRWGQVDFQRNVIYVPNSKTGKDYPVPMNEDVRGVMLTLRREASGAEYVFINPKTGKPYTDIKRAFSAACEKAKIKGLHWHDLRHTFGTRLAEAGFSEATIAELMGHSNPRTTRRYTHGTDRAKREAVEAVRRSHTSVCHNPATKEEQRPKLAAVSC